MGSQVGEAYLQEFAHSLVKVTAKANLPLCSGPHMHNSRLTPKKPNLLIRKGFVLCISYRHNAGMIYGYARTAKASSRKSARSGGRAPEPHPETLRRYAATAPSLPKWNSVPSTHMRWSTEASLRANATLARFMPRR